MVVGWIDGILLDMTVGYVVMEEDIVNIDVFWFLVVVIGI